MPESRLANWPKTKSKKATSPTEDSEHTAVEETTPIKAGRGHGRRTSRYSGFEDFPVNPSSFRKSIIEAARRDDVESEESTDAETDNGNENAVTDGDFGNSTPDQPLLNQAKGKGYGSIKKRKSIDHKAHNHRKPKEEKKGGGHGHSHGDLNMRGVFLHVMGDALGNIGVIGTALFIWLTDFSWRFYADPFISLVITVIILCSAIPLCKAASRILLQAVPAGISVDEIKEDIETLPGIVSCHHLHVWQLSDTKLVASLHVQVDYDFEGEGSARYMQLARAIRDCLHEYGIHSSTIQPEFCLDPEHDHGASAEDHSHHEDHDDSHKSTPNGKAISKQASKAGSLRAQPDACLLECGDACGDGKTCCAVPDKKGPGHDDHHGHDH